MLTVPQWQHVCHIHQRFQGLQPVFQLADVLLP